MVGLYSTSPRSAPPECFRGPHSSGLSVSIPTRKTAVINHLKMKYQCYLGNSPKIISRIMVCKYTVRYANFASIKLMKIGFCFIPILFKK
jgi:hypothetical protein